MTTAHHRVVVVGTGFSGLGMAIRLQQAGIDDFVVLEKAQDLGGTWRDNRYPGCACDVPSKLYSFSFEQNPRWSRDYAPATEIWEYLRDCADRYGVRERIAFGAELAEAHYDEPARRWRLSTVDGRRWSADSLVLGVGALHQPAVPDLPGLGSFAGPVIHSARWPGDDCLDGLRVGVVGTGASSVQIVPALAPRAARVTVFQRTPAWILPKRDSAWSDRRKAAFARHPVLQRAARWGTYWELESRVLGFRFPKVMRLAERMSLRHLQRSVSDPVTRAKLTPHYTMGCKRILISDDYWPAFEREDVELVTDRITGVEPGALVTADGSHHEVDAIVLGTGFTVTGSFDRLDVRGLGGRRLSRDWRSGMHTNLGITVAGYPELYLLLGPNTGLGHSSVIVMIEFAIDYVLRCLRRGEPMVVTEQAQRSFAQEMEHRSRGTVWSSGCHSWYLDALGRNHVVWPGSTLSYWWRTRRARAADFVSVPSQAADVVPVPSQAPDFVPVPSQAADVVPVPSQAAADAGQPSHPPAGAVP